MLMSTALTPIDKAISGKAVLMTEPSRFSMKKALATMRGTMWEGWSSSSSLDMTKHCRFQTTTVGPRDAQTFP